MLKIINNQYFPSNKINITRLVFLIQNTFFSIIKLDVYFFEKNYNTIVGIIKTFSTFAHDLHGGGKRCY